MITELRRFFLLTAGGALLLTAPALRAEGLKFEDVFNAVRTNLVGVTEKELNETAIEAFLTQLQPRVLLVTNDLLTDAAVKGPFLSKSTVYDASIAYLRVGRVAEGLAAEISQAYAGLQATNKLKGLVLDLRFASGTDYAATGAAADLFLSKEKLLLDWGAASARSTAKSSALTLPLAVLTNGKTAGAAEALAAVLRQNEIGLAIGGKTAGQAEVFKELKLDNGLRLMIAIALVKLSDGQPLAKTGLAPDIAVNVNFEEEATYWNDPFVAASKRASASQTSPMSSSQPTRRRVNEADLVRMQKDGAEPDSETTTAPRKSSEPAKPIVRDPVLARALDLLKGLAVVQRSSPAAR
ncbi:MAG: hypothetical protein HY043_20035 [Verrucomicrobia bacterium]|nr:hypothetical protein [Verrucomicrobiota bacterium]